MDNQKSLTKLDLYSVCSARAFRTLGLALLLFCFSFNQSYGQTVLLSDPGMSYTNSDMTTGPDVYPVNISTCTSISFSVDFSFSLPWEGGGNMEFCNETSPVTGQPVCFSTATPCACDPTTPSAGSCNGCWDFLWVNFNMGGANVGGDLIGDAGTTDADQFGTISTGPICTNGATTADINVVTQTWASNETVTFTNLVILCWEGVPTVSTNAPICGGQDVMLNGMVNDPTVVTNWMWTNTGTGVISNPSVPNTTASTPSNGETYTLTTTDVNSCTASDDVMISLFPVPNTGVPIGPTSECNSTNNLFILNDLLTGEDAGGTWTETSVPNSSSFNPVPGTFNPLGEAPGTYTFEYSIAAPPPCLSNSSTVTFIISAAPEAGNPNPPITECNTNNNLINLNGELTLADPGGTWIETSVPSSTSFNPVPGTFNPLGEAAGTYTFQYTVPGIPPCPDDMAVVTINVNAGPDAGTPNPPTTTCNNVMSPIDLNGELFGQTPGGTWTETSAVPSSGGAFNPVPGTFNPNMQAMGTYTFQYEVMGIFPCANVQSTVTVIVQAASNPGIPNPPIFVCPANAPIILSDELIGEDPGGLWSETSVIPSVSGVNPIIGVFNPAGESPGTYSFDYTIIGIAPCADVSATVTVVITPGANAGTANPPIIICNSNATPISLFDELNGADAGGTWSETSTISSSGGVNAVTGIFIPSIGETAGTYTFEYFVPGVPPCPNDTETVTVIILDAPDAGDSNLPLIICDNTTTPIPLFNELIGADTGGTWTEVSFPATSNGVDPITGIFDPSGEAPGSYTFEYSIVGTPPCPTSISTVSVIIQAGPNAGTANPPITICNDSTNPISLPDELNGETSGGTWTETSATPSSSGVNAVTGIFNPTGEAAGTYTFEYSVSGGMAACPSDTETVTVIIQAAPNAGTANPPITICNNSTTPIPLFDELNGETSGGTWTDTSPTPSTNGVNAVTGIFDPTGEAIGTYTFEYSIVGIAPCLNDNETVTVIIQAPPNAGTANPPITICNNSTAPISLFDELNGETSGGTWSETSLTPSTSGVNAITGIFTPTGEATGTYTFEYSIIGIAPCPNDAETVTIIIQAAPNAGIANPPTTVCNDSTTPISLFDELTGETSGGTWSETSVTPSTGGFNAATGIFIPTGEATGTYTFEYSLTGIAPCPNDTETVTVIIQAAPNAGTANPPITICNNSTMPISLLDELNGETSGGAWVETSATPSSSGVNAVTGIFNPTGEATGTYTFEYSLTGIAPCPNDAETVTVIIQAAPSAGTANPPLSVCNSNTSSIALFDELNGETSGGTWTETSATPSTSGVNATTGIFNPLGENAGTYTFEYSVTGIAPCPNDTETVTIIIEEEPSATVASNATICDLSAQGSILDFSGFVTAGDMGGSWTEPVTTSGVSLIPINAVDFNGVTPGTYTFAYTTASATAPCAEQTYLIDVLVQDCTCPDVATAAPGDLCNDDDDLDLTTLVITALPGTWAITTFPAGGSTAPLTGNIFDATAAIPGNYEITYTLNIAPIAGCPDSSVQVITVHPIPEQGTPLADLEVCDSDNTLVTLNDRLTGETSGGTWTETSAVPSTGGAFNPIPGTFNPNAQNAGTYTFNYLVNGIAPCPSVSNTVAIIVHPEPSATVSPDATICNLTSQGSVLDFTSFVTAGDMGGSWTEPVTTSGVSLLPINAVDFNGITAGTYTFAYTTASATTPCTEQTYLIDIVVQDCACPDVTTAAPGDLCNDDDDLDLSTLVITVLPGTWAITDFPIGSSTAPLTGNIFDATAAIPGDYEITYTLNIAPIVGCPDSSVQVITVHPTPEAGTALADLEVCDSDNSLVVLNDRLTGETSGGTWTETSAVPSTGGAFNPSPGTFNPNAQNAGTYTFNYLITGTTPCPNVSNTVSIIVHPEPSATVSTNATICNLTSQGSILDFTSFVTAGDMGGSWIEPVTTSGVSLLPINAVDFNGITPGTYTFAYTTNSATAPCTEQTYLIDVLVQNCICPDVATASPADLCNDDDNLDLSTLVITALPGTWAITDFPVGSSTAPLTGNIFDATAAIPGDYEITYTLNIAPIVGCPDSSVQVLTVHPIPTATVSTNATICNLTSQGSILDFTSFVTAGDLGGSWTEPVTSSGVSLLPINAVDFNGITPGTYTFAYTTNSATAPCTEQTYLIDVLVQNCICPDVTTASPADLCNDDDNLDLSTLVVTPLPGTWAITDFPIGSSTAPLTGNIFDATAAIPGDYEITYTLNIAPIVGCPDSSVQILTVIDAPNSGIVGSPIEICNNSNIPIAVNDLLTGEDAGGTWTETSTVPSTGSAWDPIAGTFNPSAQLAGLYTFQYTLMGNLPCGLSSSTVSIEVQARPLATVETIDTVCNLTALGSTLDFTSYVTGGDLGGNWMTTLGVDLTNLSSVDFNGIAPGSYDFTYTTNSAIAPCTEQSYTMVIVVETCACPSVETIPPGPLCNNESVDLNTFLITTESGTWSITDMPPGTPPTLIGSSFDATGATPGIYEITFTLDNPSGTCPTSSSQNITIQASANAGIPGSTSICNPQMGQEIDLYNLLSMSTTGGIWTTDPTSPNTPLPGALNQITGEFDPFNHPNGTYVFLYLVIGSPLCPPATTTATVVINNVDISISGNLDFCPGDTTDLFATFGFANYNWSVPGNTTSLLEVFAAGNYSVTVSDASGCSDEASVLVTELISPSGNLDTILCVGDSLVINGTVYNASNPMGSETLNDMASNGCDSILGITVSYYMVADSTLQETLCPDDFIMVNGTVYDINNPTGSETIMGASQHGCDSFVIINLSFFAEMTAGITGDPVICSGDTATLTFNFTGQGPFDIEYSDGINIIPLSGLTNGTSIQVVITNPTTFTLTNVSSSANPTCAVLVPNNTFMVDVTQVDLVASVDSDFNGYGVSCPDSDNGILSASANNGTGPYVYSWDNGGNGALLENVGAGTYFVRTTDANGCTSETAVSLAAPPEPVVDLLAERPSCYAEEDGILIISDITGPGSNYSFSVDGEPFQSVGNLPFLLTGLPSGIYDLAVEDENNCRLDQSITIPQANEIGLDLGEDVIIELGDSVWLSPVTNIDSFSWEWNTVDYLSCDNCFEPYAKPFNSTVYSISIRDSMGCEASDDIFIQVRTDINVYIPNGFSPDGNGDNDFFFVQSGRNDIQIKNMSIYDRWGEVVFSRNSFLPNIANLGWDGSFGGEKLNPAVFVYVVELEYINGQVEILSGDVTLVR